MEFRAPTFAAQENAATISYFTKNLSNPEAARHLVDGLFEELGNAVGSYPDWHPIWTAPQQVAGENAGSWTDLRVYQGLDHTREFVRGFVTCPYSDDRANQLVDAVNEVPGLYAYRLSGPLYADSAFPVVVVATGVELEADGTIRSRDALAWFVQQLTRNARSAEVAETWWNIRTNILGRPHGSRSSLFVNPHTGSNMRKILDALNASGVFGPVLEDSLAMLSQKKLDKINETLIRAALKSWDRQSEEFEFELRGEICKAQLRDTWDDGMELSVRVRIGNYDLHTSGFYYADSDKITHLQPRGKRKLAEKFL